MLPDRIQSILDDHHFRFPMDSVVIAEVSQRGCTIFGRLVEHCVPEGRILAWTQMSPPLWRGVHELTRDFHERGIFGESPQCLGF